MLAMGYMGPVDGAEICVQGGSSPWGVPSEGGQLWGQPCSSSRGRSSLQKVISGATRPEISACPSQDLGLFMVICSFLNTETNSLTTLCRFL